MQLSLTPNIFSMSDQHYLFIQNDRNRNIIPDTAPNMNQEEIPNIAINHIDPTTTTIIDTLSSAPILNTNANTNANNNDNNNNNNDNDNNNNNNLDWFVHDENTNNPSFEMSIFNMVLSIFLYFISPFYFFFTELQSFCVFGVDHTDYAGNER